jgi:arginyl-tRNA synthetase
LGRRYGSVGARRIWIGAWSGQENAQVEISESVGLGELLDEAAERARRQVDKKSPSHDERERFAIAQSVGIGAVKYADVANDRIKDYLFDWNRCLLSTATPRRT